jgi:Protein of unknown function (DUF1194)
MSLISKRRLLTNAGAVSAATALPGLWRSARAEDLVDVMLVLSADVSRSLDDEKFRLQREGYAAAINDPAILRLIQGGKHGRIALQLVEWSNAFEAAVMVEWSPIATAEHAAAFAAQVRTVERRFKGRTSISTGIDEAVRQLSRCPFIGDRKVIDVSGDGTHNHGRDLSAARNEALAKGITINGIVILSAVPLAFNPAHTHPPGGLQKYYEDNVIGGPGAFALAAEGFNEFAQAFRQKLIREIAWATRQSSAVQSG